MAIVGRPNVGKSTLLNALVGQKISITSRKAQTTRHRIVGVRTRGAAQFVFVDTPGFQTRHAQALNRNLNRAVRSSLSDVDLVLLVAEAGRFGRDDQQVRGAAAGGRAGHPGGQQARPGASPRRPAALAAGAAATSCLRRIRADVGRAQRRRASACSTSSSRTCPSGPGLHDPDALTDRDERFLAAEIVREKLFRLTGDELPYTSTVVLDRFEEWDAEAPDEAARSARRRAPRNVHIAATIVVERDAHKAMVIGQGGERLKRIGTEARHELQHLLDARVHLALWVQVRSGWADDERHLRSYGIG